MIKLDMAQIRNFEVMSDKVLLMSVYKWKR